MDETLGLQAHEGLADRWPACPQFAREGWLTRKCSAAVNGVKPDPADPIGEHNVVRAGHVRTLSQNVMLAQSRNCWGGCPGTLERFRAGEVGRLV